MQFIKEDGKKQKVDEKPQICKTCPHRKTDEKAFAIPKSHTKPFTLDDLEWISTEQLVTDSFELMEYVDPDTTGIVAIPRSGLIPATVIATHAHLPLFQLTNRGLQALGSGSRGRNFPRGKEKLLVIDDSSHNGGAMRRARVLMRGRNATFAVVYTLTKNTVDVYARLLDKIHIFDWNILNNAISEGRAIDPRLRGVGYMLDWDGILNADTPFQPTPL